MVAVHEETVPGTPAVRTMERTGADPNKKAHELSEGSTHMGSDGEEWG